MYAQPSILILTLWLAQRVLPPRPHWQSVVSPPAHVFRAEELSLPADNVLAQEWRLLRHPHTSERHHLHASWYESRVGQPLTRRGDAHPDQPPLLQRLEVSYPDCGQS